tara:strand:- start:3573 stop:3761 length:189 start_codon:yes stop_codon:yes gene_type:complete
MTTWKEIQKDLSKEMNKNFLTREEGMEILKALESLTEWNKSQQKLVVKMHDAIEKLEERLEK